MQETYMNNTNLRLSKSDKEDYSISFTIIFQFCILITNYAFKEIFQIYDTNLRALISLVFMLIVGILFIINLHIVLRRILTYFVSSYLFFVVIYLITIMLFPENIKYLIEPIFWFFLICLPTSLFYLAVHNKKIFINMLVKSAYYQMFVGLIIFTSILLNTGIYDMVFSYLLLFPIIILTYKTIKIKYSIFDIVLLVLALASIVTIGSRGPLISFIGYIILLITSYITKGKYKIRIVKIFFTLQLFFVFLILNMKLILTFFYNLLLSNGIQSRTLYLLLSDNIDFSTGRSVLYDSTILHIIKNPIFGYGIAGDRIFLNGTYPHNVFLEIIAQFGIVIGVVILIIFIFYWISGLFFNKNETEQQLAIIFASLGLIPLFYSGTYLTSSNYWLFLTICISSVHFKINSSIKNTNDCFEKKV